MCPAELLVILESECLSARVRQHTPVMLWGPPGAWASRRWWRRSRPSCTAVIDIRLSQMEASGLRASLSPGQHR